MEQCKKQSRNLFVYITFTTRNGAKEIEKVLRKFDIIISNWGDFNSIGVLVKNHSIWFKLYVYDCGGLGVKSG